MEPSQPASTTATIDPNGARRSSGRLHPLNPACVICGFENPNGLRLSFHCSSQEVTAEWSPTESWESFRGVIHGGIITAVLDEAMSKAVIARGCEALTVELRVRLRKQVSPGDALHVRGWVVEKRKRRILTEAVLKTAAGEEHAHAWAVFLVVPAPPADMARVRP